ncbi:MAG: SpoIID/LytB domain-containing protein [Clostridia bacterium]|nr:SpoIID/LytB domain-containing protein [Clostridia bacterium]
MNCTTRRLSGFLCAVLLLLSSVALGEGAADAAQAGSASMDGGLRVYLKSLGTPESLGLTFEGTYSLGGSAGFVFDDGASVTLRAADSQVWMKSAGLSVNLGEEASFVRHDEKGGLYIAQSSRGNVYQGSLKVRANGSGLQAILTIDVETYLKGVVPYEMSDSWPMEALKAQAVAARTYALWRKDARSSQEYDVVDTPADQVFHGYSADNVNAAAAVDATRGLVGLYGGRCAAAYYTASNGGQTALAGDILGAKENDAYLDVREDPYDLENPLSNVKTMALERDFRDAPEALTAWLRAAAASQLEKSETPYSLALSDIQPVELISAKALDPKGGEGSLQFTTLRLTYKVSARPLEPVFAEPTTEQRVRAALRREAPVTEVVGEKPGEAEVCDALMSCDLQVYGQVKDELGLKLNAIDCELLSVIEEEDIVVLQMRRYGHGVGMSQRGAQMMAGQHGMAMGEILAFYYPGLSFETLTLTEPETVPIGEAPVTSVSMQAVRELETGEGEIVGVVTLATPTSTLNVRAEPSTTAPVLTYLYSGTQVAVTEIQDEWVKIRTRDGMEGYCARTYVVWQAAGQD